MQDAGRSTTQATMSSGRIFFRSFSPELNVGPFPIDDRFGSLARAVADHESSDVLPETVAGESLPIRRIDAGQSHPESLLVNQNGRCVSVRDLDQLADQRLRMNRTRTDQLQAYQHFSPFRGAADDASCRTCAHSVGLLDGHHLFCQRARIVPVCPCGSWERTAAQLEGGGGDT